jgi:hypothetical protein
MEMILRERKLFMGQDDHNSNGDYGQFPTEWEILHDFCGMGVHGFDEMFFSFFVSYPTNDNHPLRAGSLGQVNWPVHCN